MGTKRIRVWWGQNRWLRRLNINYCCRKINFQLFIFLIILKQRTTYTPVYEIEMRMLFDLLSNVNCDACYCNHKNHKLYVHIFLYATMYACVAMWRDLVNCTNTPRGNEMDTVRSTLNSSPWIKWPPFRRLYFQKHINSHETARYGEIASAILNFFVCCMEMG